MGMGLVALDVILNGSPETLPKLFAGGSCGNVLAILGFLGWKSYPVARLSNDNAAEELVEDLERWGVKTELVFKRLDGSTPVIIHRILKDKSGKPKHKFEFKIPDTGKWLPHFKPLVNADTDLIKNKVSRAKVFYFDRATRSSIEMATYYKSQGALIIFEPSSIGEERLFNESIAVANILKFSQDRIPDYNKRYPSIKSDLEIRTLGSQGLEYRTKKSKNKLWKHVTAPIVGDIQDAAGAGDWCTAGIIHSLGGRGEAGFKDAGIRNIETALQNGQYLGALNCKFDGARGLMYNTTFRSITQNMKYLSEGKMANLKTRSSETFAVKNFSFQELLEATHNNI